VKHLVLPAARIRPALALSACALLAATACSGVTGNARVEPAEASGDGILRVGLVLDSTGDSAFLNAPQLAAAKLAIKEINAAGGHKGRPVELLPVDQDLDAAAQAHALVAGKADVVIGPTDSSNAEATIDVLSRARTPLISPANTAAGLTGADSGGYYFRTAAADIAQAPVLAKLAKDAGAATVFVVQQEGSYGKDVAAAVSDAAVQTGLRVAGNEEFAPGDAARAADAARQANADSVILVARDGAQDALAELNNAGMAGSRMILSDGAFARYGSKLAAKALDGARALVPGRLPSAGFQERLLAVDGKLKDVSFAAETYDAVTVAALSAAKARDDAGRSIAANLVSVSGGAAVGTPAAAACTTYKDCVSGLASDTAFNYDGESGPIAFDANGDITTANFSVFTYGPDNLPTASGLETAGRSGS
jgi:branched-chain amino acid transport system substrate-binding protein